MSAARLEDMLDRAARDAQHDHACGLVALHNVAEAAIARVRVLERALADRPAKDERRTRSDLYPRGEVIALPRKQDAPTRRTPPLGA